MTHRLFDSLHKLCFLRFHSKIIAQTRNTDIKIKCSTSTFNLTGVTNLSRARPFILVFTYFFDLIELKHSLVFGYLNLKETQALTFLKIRARRFTHQSPVRNICYYNKNKNRIEFNAKCPRKIYFPKSFLSKFSFRVFLQSVQKQDSPTYTHFQDQTIFQNTSIRHWKSSFPGFAIR